jgi:hypothetical protein
LSNLCIKSSWRGTGFFGNQFLVFMWCCEKGNLTVSILEGVIEILKTMANQTTRGEERVPQWKLSVSDTGLGKGQSSVEEGTIEGMRQTCPFNSVKSSIWFAIATNRSKNMRPPLSISTCIVPLRLKVLRLRIIKAR